MEDNDNYNTFLSKSRFCHQFKGPFSETTQPKIPTKMWLVPLYDIDALISFYIDICSN